MQMKSLISIYCSFLLVSYTYTCIWASLVAQTVKEATCNAGNLGLIPRLGRRPGEGNGNPLQYSCLENLWTEEPGGLQSMGLQRVRHH